MSVSRRVRSASDPQIPAHDEPMSRTNQILLIVGVVVGLFAAPTASASDHPQTLDAEELVLQLSDMDAGWTKHSEGEDSLDEPGFREGYSTRLVKAGQYTTRSIKTFAWIFETKDDAEAYYNQEKADVEDTYSTTEMDYGDGAIKWFLNSDNGRLLIYDDWVVWKAETFRDGTFSWEPSHDWIADTLSSKYVPPNAVPIPNISIRETGLKVLANGSESVDPDGSIAAYQWDWGDGTSDAGQEASHTYTNNGTFRINLTVTDNEGATNSTGVEVNVTNAPPKADFSFRPSDPTIGDSVRFSDKSTDVDGKIATRDWSFTNNTTSHEENPEYTFPEAGTFEVTLIVRDDHNSSDSMSKSIKVSEPPAEPPDGQEDPGDESEDAGDETPTTPGFEAWAIVALTGVVAVLRRRES